VYLIQNNNIILGSGAKGHKKPHCRGGAMRYMGEGLRVVLQILISLFCDYTAMPVRITSS